MKAEAAGETAGLLPRRCRVFHDLRHTFARRLLIYLTELALQELRRRGSGMATLLEHMSGNPLLQVQRRLGHASPATTYRYIRYLKDPMRDVAQAGVDRIGVRQVTVPATGAAGLKSATVQVSFEPGTFECALLAAEFADEWVELVVAARLGEGATRSYLTAMKVLLAHIEATMPDAAEASLARTEPVLQQVVAGWVRVLPSQHRAGSRTPGWHAGRIRALIARRMEHPGRSVAAGWHGWIDGAVGVRRGSSSELDEFSRADKKNLIRAASAARRVTTARIRRGRGLAAGGTDPERGGWLSVENLLWALWSDAGACERIPGRLPPAAQFPAELHELAPGEVWHSQRHLMQFLVAELFVTAMDLHAYRILLMAATGRAPEEITGLTEDDVEFGPHGVTITFTKRRARARRRQTFTAEPEAAGTLHPPGSRLDAAEIVGELLELNRPLARLAGISPVPLFLRASRPSAALVAGLLTRSKGFTFSDWLRLHGVTVAGPVDIRRLRKTTKVEKAIAFQGRISDIADDHSEQTFRGHYAHGTTLRVIAGEVITAAQRRWLDTALAGPTVLDEPATRSLADPQTATALGLDPAEAEALRTGQLNMGITDCTDPFASPFGRPGQLCPVAPLRCLECRNAFVLPSNLPQLLLFAEHLDQLALRLTPTHFHALWGQSRANLDEVLRSRTDAELAEARRQIAQDGIILALPTAARVEFDA